MFCTQCGNKLEDNAAFCTQCGAKVNCTSNDTSEIDKTDADQKLKNSDEKTEDTCEDSIFNKTIETKKTHHRFGLIIGVVFIIVLFVVLYPKLIFASAEIKYLQGNYLDAYTTAANIAEKYPDKDSVQKSVVKYAYKYITTNSSSDFVNLKMYPNGDKLELYGGPNIIYLYYASPLPFSERYYTKAILTLQPYWREGKDHFKSQELVDKGDGWYTYSTVDDVDFNREEYRKNGSIVGSTVVMPELCITMLSDGLQMIEQKFDVPPRHLGFISF